MAPASSSLCPGATLNRVNPGHVLILCSRCDRFRYGAGEPLAMPKHDGSAWGCAAYVERVTAPALEI